MKKLLYLTLILSFATPCYADDPEPAAEPNPNIEYNSAVVLDNEADGLDALADIPLRITGFIQTILGTAVFVGVSPITAFMTIQSPHDAMDKVAKYLIVQPARYTFDRPIGDFDYNTTVDSKE